jgi:hypothetical protein
MNHRYMTLHQNSILKLLLIRYTVDVYRKLYIYTKHKASTFIHNQCHLSKICLITNSMTKASKQNKTKGNKTFKKFKISETAVK